MASGTLPSSQLAYRVEGCAPTAPGGQLHKNRAERLVLMPDVALRECYTVTAVIDRMVILIDVARKVDRLVMQRTITRETSAAMFACDLTIDAKTQEWGVPLPIPDLSKQTGYHFAIMIQDPTPKLLKSILEAINRNYMISGEVGLHLVEISGDFYPRKPVSSEDSILRREQIVGLLQRHHWVSPDKLLDVFVESPSDVDARQVHLKVDRSGTSSSTPRYLFSHGNVGRHHADHDLKESIVRQRILTSKAGNDLYLNSTLVKGAHGSSIQISIQHKIADRRNSKKAPPRILSDDARRARIEVTLSGTETLKELGLESVKELAEISFRKLAKRYLSFRLATCEPWQDGLDDAISQMRTRGVYGVEMKARAKVAESSGGKRTGKSQKADLTLVDWPEMNRLVGDSLDGLMKRWAGFSPM